MFIYVQKRVFPLECGYVCIGCVVVYLSHTRFIDIMVSGRQCATNQYLRKRDDPHRYCQDACAEVTRCGPVVVPQHHLQVRKGHSVPPSPGQPSNASVWVPSKYKRRFCEARGLKNQLEATI